MNNSENETKLNFAKTFNWLAWFFGIGILVFVFQDILDSKYNPNQEPVKRFDANGLAEVILQKNDYGHYVTTGKINDQVVTFLLDTGATSVAVPANKAETLGLKKGNKQRVQTANGVIIVYQTMINELKVGDITLFNVAANINPKMYDEEILLGMSVLGQLEFRQTGNQLILREQY